MVAAVTDADEYWNYLCRKTPRLAGDGSARMTLTIAEFRRAITRAYESGQGNVDTPVLPEILNENEGDFGDLLGRMFGGRN